MSWVVVVEGQGEPQVAGPYRHEGRAFAALAWIEEKLPEGARATMVPCRSADSWASSTGLSPAVDGGRS